MFCDEGLFAEVEFFCCSHFAFGVFRILVASEPSKWLRMTCSIEMGVVVTKMNPALLRAILTHCHDCEGYFVD